MWTKDPYPLGMLKILRMELVHTFRHLLIENKYFLEKCASRHTKHVEMVQSTLEKCNH